MTETDEITSKREQKCQKMHFLLILPAIPKTSKLHKTVKVNSICVILK